MLQQNNLSDIQKLTFLKGQLTGHARVSVNGISSEATNYAACGTFCKGYNKHLDVVQRFHVKVLLNLNAPRYDYKELTNFPAASECHLQSLKISTLALDEMISVILFHKLPPT